jgi:sialidase-1
MNGNRTTLPTRSTSLRSTSLRSNSLRSNSLLTFALLCLYCLLSYTPSLGQQSSKIPPPTKVELFAPAQNGIALYRIPGIVRTQQGTLLAYCEARRNGSADWGEIEIHLRRSTDDGLTWEPPVQIAHHGPRIEGNPKAKEPNSGAHEQTVNNPVAIVDRISGAIEFLYCVNYARCFSMRSLDDGITWSPPVDITNTFEPFRKHYDWKVIATGPGHGIQLRSGRLIVPIWLAYGKQGDHAPSASATIYSDDHGQTWTAGDLAVPNTPPFGNPNESIAAELSNGDVLLLSRNVSKPNRKIVTVSPNGATRWSNPNFHNELYEPICMASLIALNNPPSTLVFTHPHRIERDNEGKEKPNTRGKRENLTIRLSLDDGKTWPYAQVLEAGKAAYSDLVELPNQKIGCFYEGDRSLWFATIDKEWIVSGEANTVD